MLEPNFEKKKSRCLCIFCFILLKHFLKHFLFNATHLYVDFWMFAHANDYLDAFCIQTLLDLLIWNKLCTNVSVNYRRLLIFHGKAWSICTVMKWLEGSICASLYGCLTWKIYQASVYQQPLKIIPAGTTLIQFLLSPI